MDGVIIGDQPFQPNGWAVILAGGSASGKSTIIKDGRLLFEGEVLSTDTIGEEMIEVHNNAKYYETHDPERLKDAEKLIQKGRHGHWDITGDPNIKLDFECPCFAAGKISTILSNGGHERKKRYFKSHIQDGAKNGHRNLILDMTGKEEEMQLYSKMLTENGYQVALVWVITNMSMALLWNHRRLRSMKPKAVHMGHHAPKKYLLDALQDDRSVWFDEAWLVFNSTESWLREMTPDEKEHSILKLHKDRGRFVLEESLKDRVRTVLGPYSESEYYSVPAMEKQFLRYRFIEKYSKRNKMPAPPFEEIFPSFEMKDKDAAEANIKSFYDSIGMKEPELPKQPEQVHDVVDPVRAMYKTEDEFNEAVRNYPSQKEKYHQALHEWSKYRALFD